MRFFYLFCLILVFSLKAICQGFAPDEVLWTYNGYGLSGQHYPSGIIVKGDTVINGKAARELSIDPDACLYKPIQYQSKQYIYTDSAKVFWYNDSTSEFHLLYDFDAQVGESWYVVPANPSDSVLITIDSIQQIVLNGQLVKKFFFSYDFQWLIIGTSFIENIGFDYYLFPGYGFCDPSIGGLRCYYDSVMNQVFIDSNYYPNCDSAFSPPGINVQEITNNHVISIFPNPFKDYITLSFKKTGIKNAQIIISDINGNLAASFPLRETSQTVDLSALSRGFYVLSIRTNGNNVISYQKLIKL